MKSTLISCFAVVCFGRRYLCPHESCRPFFFCIQNCSYIFFHSIFIFNCVVFHLLNLHFCVYICVKKGVWKCTCPCAQRTEWCWDLKLELCKRWDPKSSHRKISLFAPWPSHLCSLYMLNSMMLLSLLCHLGIASVFIYYLLIAYSMVPRSILNIQKYQLDFNTVTFIFT